MIQINLAAGVLIGIYFFSLLGSSLSDDTSSCIKRCVRKNIQENDILVEDNYASASNSVFLDCLRNTCLIVTSQCPRNTNHTDDNPVCSPPSLNISETPDKHMIIEWNPCSQGLYAVKGYNVTIEGYDDASFVECYNMSVQFTIEDPLTQFALVSNAKLNYSSRYSVLVESLPLTKENKRPKRHTYISKNCTDWHSLSSCKCAFEEVLKTYYSAFTVDNYTHTVTVAFGLLPACYNISQLSVELALYDGKDKETRFVIQKKLIDNVYKVAPIEETFYNVFPPNTGYELKAEVYAIRAERTLLAVSKKLSTASKPAKVPWICKTDNDTSNPINNVYTMCFQAFHSYQEYTFQVRQCSDTWCKALIDLPVKPENATANPITFDLNMDGVVNGVYFVRVREQRPEGKHLDKFESAPWSGEHKINHFLYYEPYTPPPSVLVSAVLFCIVLAVALFTIGFYLCRNDYCTTYISGEMGEKLKMLVTAQPELEEKKLWLVWMMDHRSQQLRDGHSQVIRDLAAYLRVVCGIDVILDLFEEDDVIKGVSSWMQSSHERSQFVVLVCPHFHCDVIDNKVEHSFFGDFDKSFKYLEPFLANKSKYITVVLPYSIPDCCYGSRWLHKTTANYSLMDQIEDFFFHVQGCNNFGLAGKHSAEFIDRKNFVKTAEGASLQQSITRFQNLQRSFYAKEDKSGTESTDCDATTTTDSISSLDAVDQVEMPSDLDCRRTLQLCQLKIAPPVELKEDLEERSFGVKPPPLTFDDFDPEERLKLLNAV